MKIGILTFHCAHNYGAVLQAYALQEYLLSLGHEVYIIDYRPDYLVKLYQVFSRERIPANSFFLRLLVGECIRLPRYIKRYKSFNSFIGRYMRLASVDLGDAYSDFDAFVFGSDQIWNKNICGGKYDPIYLGKFGASRDRKKIAYAASAGHISMNTKDLSLLDVSLRDFDMIGVREVSLCKLLQSFFPLKVHTVLDPTLLVDRTVFDQIARKPNVSQKYIVVYQVYLSDDTNRDIMRIAESLAGQIGGIVIDLSFQIAVSAKYRRDASPEEFLGYIKYADAIITNSFHGTAFSVIFQKPFYTVKMHTEIDLRAQSLLEEIALTERFIERDAKPVFSGMDYSGHIEKMSNLRMDSRRFISEALCNDK